MTAVACLGVRDGQHALVFAQLQHALVFAMGSQGRTPGELLDGLEPKGKVLRFLVEYRDRKRAIFAFAMLVKAPAWLDAVHRLDANLPPAFEDAVKWVDQACARAARARGFVVVVVVVCVGG